MDEAHVREVINGLGGAKALAAKMAKFHKVASRMRRQRANLTDQYPDMWVAMGTDGVVAIGDSVDEVLLELESQGLHRADVVTEFIDTNPPRSFCDHRRIR